MLTKSFDLKLLYLQNQKTEKTSFSIQQISEYVNEKNKFQKLFSALLPAL